VTEDTIPSPPDAPSGAAVRLENDETRRKILNRLRRLEGQVRGLQRMVEEDRPCHDILTLIAGVRRALDATGDVILENYLDTCQGDLEGGSADSRRIVEAVRLARG
jgi:CsoR family transcriptional regulator, copper-sensing transcriptional repressor